MDTDRVVQTARFGARKAREVYAVEGARGVVRRARNWARKRRSGAAGISLLPVGPLPEVPVWQPHVLSVAERSLPQCYHYRVDQKREICQILGVPFDDLPLDDVDEVITRLQLASVLIVYRLPETPALHRVLKEADRLRVPVIYEVDDLIYRREVTANNPNLATLPADVRAAVISGSDGYFHALNLGQANLASTQPLADDMHEVNGRPGFVVDNGIDATMLEIIEGIRVQPVPPPQRDGIVVTYGSGSRANDHDFALAAPAIAAWLHETPAGLLKILGPVRLPEVLEPFSDRVLRRTEHLAYGEYLRELRDSTISLAPLTNDHFNAFKSQVKYLESALVSVPLVASPMVYENYVEDGRTGIIARTETQWFDALKSLSTDSERRSAMVAAAREHVRQWELANGPAQQFAAMLAALSDSQKRAS